MSSDQEQDDDKHTTEEEPALPDSEVEEGVVELGDPKVETR